MVKTALLFAGQGSQYVGMGKDLYEAFPESKTIFEKADKVLGFSLSRLCFEGPEPELTLTQNCQPAILTVSIAAWEAFRSVSSQQSTVNSYVAGLSLGEYSALVAAESIDFEDAVYLVRRRGEYMEEAAAKHPGKMLSIIGMDLSAVRDICAATAVELANLNCPAQVVVSGSAENIAKAAALAEERGAKRVMELEVSGAFHSSFMLEASSKLAGELVKIKINAPKIPLVSNVSAKEVASPLEIKDNLIKQVSSSVYWEDSMKFILSQGVANFFEFGPGKVLKGLMRRIDASAEVINIEKKDDILGVRF